MPINWSFLDTRSAIQKFMDSATSIEFSRADLVATSVSRSGRVITQTRNTVKPWNFKVSPPPIMSWSQYRQEIEELFIKDRHTEHEIKLGGNSGSAWLSEYQGGVTKDAAGVLDNVTVTAVSGNSLTIDTTGITIGTIIFEAGDILQFAGVGSDGEAYRYPYAVVSRVTKGASNSNTVTLNRGYIIQADYDPTSATTEQNTIRVGNACSWRVIVTSLPGVRYLPGKLVEFTSEVSMLEVVL